MVCNLPPVDDDAVSSNMTSRAESLNLMHGTETRGVSVEWRHSLQRKCNLPDQHALGMPGPQGADPDVRFADSIGRDDNAG
ncbi:hypothetical protein HMPREF1301_02324 [Propionibacterium sp. KPL2005]|nr:hypothetical protein HMPREF1301_02324 [Propionibacterium sp. KPL2005]ERS26454.1 hypothetical protein HMPREF1297_02036 [Propionibacterium sp. KPL2000]BDY02480.1 hypothetical protein TPCV302_18720 [Cutibacterium avidum]